jgi:parallel beta-helix repeat protein
VTNTADSGAGSLRQCLASAAAGDTIVFNPSAFPPASPATIHVTSGQLPDLDDGNVTIDASSAGVIVDGSAFSGGEDGLGITSDGNTVKGLQILHFPGDAIEITGGGNTIGGATAGSRNVLSGNGQNGIHIHGAGAVSNTVKGNFIGADASGLHALANGQDGVSLSDSASYNLIGGPAAGDRNLIFANGHSGVNIYTGGTQHNTVQGNWIGLPAAGAVRQAFPTDQAISPAYASDCTLFIATLTSGIYKSTDCGATWAEANTGLTELRLLQVKILPDAANAATVFALAENGSLFGTTDGGAHWSLVSRELEKVDRRNLVLSSLFGTDHTMYVAAQNWARDELGGEPGVFKSTDGGVTWARVANGMTDTHAWKVVASADLDAAGVVFALVNGGIVRTTDGGANWTMLAPPDGSYNDLAVSPAYATDHTVVVTSWSGQVYRSTDGGAAWTSIADGLGDPRYPAFSPAYATDHTLCHGQNWGGNDRVTCTTDNGATWAAGNTGLKGGGMSEGATVLAFAPNFASNHTLFAISQSGIAKSASGGAAWQGLTGLREAGNPTGVSIGGRASLNSVLGNVISNNGEGVRIADQETPDNTIGGNLIGTDPTGAFAQANTGDGIAIGGYRTTVGGAAGRNVISGNLVDGVRVAGDRVTGNVVAGNYIGTNISGTAALGNRGAGISIHSTAHDNLIGGSTAAARNIISGNGYGIGIWDSGTVSNTVSGNYIGVDVTGTAALGNGNGIQINNGASLNVIGGTTAGERNVISGNSNQGLRIWDSNTAYNRVVGNYIGLDATGAAALGNRSAGVHLSGGTHHNIVGGPNEGERNVVSGNGDQGIGLWSTGTSDNTVEGNYLGTDASGNVAVGNWYDGVHLNGASRNTVKNNLISGNRDHGVQLCCDSATSDNRFISNRIGVNAAGTGALPNSNHGIYIHGGAHHNIFGGAGAGEGNLIRNNRGSGVQVQDGNSLANTLTRNSIGHNDGAGITLRDGGNANLPAPRITAKNLAAGTAGGTACAGCTVEVFSAADDEGQIYEGTDVADGSGAWALVAGHAFAGPNLTATATDAAGNTSPFSSPFNLLVFDMHVSNTRQALDNLGLSYTLVDAAGFAAVNLADYDVLFVGFTGNDPQPDDLLQPLLTRKAAIAAFVQAGGGLVANSEDGVVRTALDWQWTPVTVTHRNAGGQQMRIVLPGHELVEGLTEVDLQGWHPFHNTFTQWAWPEAEVVLTDPGSGEAVVLAGAYGAGRMVLSGSDPDYHSGNTGADRLLSNELYWAAKMLRPRPPQVSSFAPGQDVATATTALIQVAFDKLMAPATINVGTFTVVGSASGAHAGTFTYLAGSAQAVFAPAVPFTVGERVTVTARGSITDLAGRGLDGNRDGVAGGPPADDFSWSFTVRAGGTCLVGSTADSGAGTLRQCLQDAQPGDTIAFAPAVFPPDSPATIALTSGALPELNRGYVTVDAGNLGVILDGGGLGSGSGFRITSAGNAIYGLRIVRFPDDGVQIDGSAAWHNTIGMVAGGRRNVIAANGRNGIRICNGASRNTVGSNFIGVDAPSWAALPNGESGVAIHDGASYNLIGAAAAVEMTAADLSLPPGNVIFTNVDSGVSLWGGGTVSNTVTGNWLGLRPGEIPQATPADMAISPAYTTDGIVYVATASGGIYKTTDRGVTWAQVNSGLTEQQFAAVRIPPDATNASTAYALAEGGALFVTHDGAATWSLVSRVLGQLDRRGLTFSPRFATDHTIYTAARNWAWNEIGGQPGVFKSTDGGVTWNRASNGMADTRINKVVASTDGATAGVLYALGDNGLQKSTDGGANWSAVTIPAGNLQDVALSPAFGADGTLVVTSGESGGQFLISTDRGATWASHPDPRNDPRHLAFSPNFATDRRICHGGGWNDHLYCTTDGGATWTQTRTLLPGGSQDWATSVAFAPGFAANRTIFVFSIAGMSRSTNGGASWQLLRGLRDLGNTSGIKLSWGASYNTIGPKNVIANNNFGIQFGDEATSHNVVIGNLIGLTPDGTKALPNSDQQIGHWGGHHNRIGGPAAGDGNTIAGGPGGYNGIYLARRETHDILVQGNRIGTDASGLVALGVGGDGIGITEGAYNNTLLNNVIAAGSHGISIRDSDTRGNRVAGNMIGLGADGRTLLGNRNRGVEIRNGSHDNLIGGSTPADRNLIAGNGGDGVSIEDSDTRNNTVAGNWIGLNTAGALAANGRNGVQIGNGSHDNLIGGPGVPDRNVIAGNGADCDWCDGVWMGNDAHHNIIQNNFIGTDPAGAVAIPNRGEGIELWGSNDNAILGNLVSGNNSQQIALWNGSQRNRLEGNRVGTDASGGRPIAGVTVAATVTQASAAEAVRYEPCQGPESYGGLEELGEAAPADREAQWCGSRPDAEGAAAVTADGDDRPGIYIKGASRNTIGASNTIAFNSGDGVRVEDDNTLENTISANSIHHNGGLGIRLSNGANRNLPAPRVLGVHLATGVVTGTACAGCRVEVFSTADEEGQTFMGATVAGGDGKWAFDAGGPLAGPNITATATDAQGDTSPFSALVNILWVNLGVNDGRDALDRLGMPYTEVSGAAFAGTDLSQYNVLFIGSARWAPNPTYLQPLVDRKAAIAAFVTAGGGLVALGQTGEWGNGRTELDWTWLPVTVTAQADMGRKRLIAPAHLAAQGLTSNDFLQWYSNSGYYFTTWNWPGATSVAQGGLDTDSQLLAGPYGSGRMALAGSFADADNRGDNLLRNLLLWAGGRLADAPPRFESSYPAAGGFAAPGTGLRLTFSEIISPTTVTPADGLNRLTVVGSRSGAFTGQILTFPDLNVVRFLPNRAFQAGETVTVTLAGTIQDMTGNGLDGNGNGRSDGSPVDDVKFKFMVRAGETITVTTTNVAGAGSLSDALGRALPGDRIVFDPVVFPPHNPATIGPAQALGQAVANNGWLPDLDAGYITIDASEAGVILDADGRAPGLLVRSDGNTLRGLTIIHGNWTNLTVQEGASFNTIGGDRAVGAGINGQGNTFGRARWSNAVIEGAGTISNTVRGNHFGTDPKGLERWSSKENYQAGLRVGEGVAFTTVDRNLFSGNSGDGLELNGSDDGRITNNRLGTDRAGMAALANNDCGVDMQDGAQRNWLQGNLFGGNIFCGLQTDDRGTRNNTVTGNSFGPDAAAAAVLPGQSVGLFVFEYAEQMLVDGNVFGGGEVGIYSRSYGSVYRNNAIGTNLAGTANWHVRWVGLFLYGRRWSAGVDESYGNLVEGNLIVHNAQGVMIQSQDGTRVDRNTLRRNRIYDSTGSDIGGGMIVEDGISLLGGANGGILPPIVLAANPATGAANGTACAGCTVEVFSDADDEGRWYEGTATANASGVWAVAVGHAFTGPAVHATATDAAGNTSEFSSPAPLIASVTPSSTTPGATQLGVLINGDFFRDNPPLTASFGAGINVTKVQYLNRRQVKAYLDIAPSAAVGPRDVRVTSYDGQSGTLPGGFRVIALPPPPPAVNAVIAEVVAPGVTGDLQVVGAGFIDLPRVQFSGAGVQVNRVTFKNATTLWINVTVAPTAMLGARTVTVTNPDGQSASRPVALTVVAPFFSDVAAAAGLRNSSGEHGAAWGDWNRDGWLDLAVGRGMLFTNQTGVFTDTTAAAGLDAISDHGGVGWGDYDNDGKPDLLSSWGKVYRNPGSLPFAKVQDGVDWTGSSWVDFDRDGKLDYYAAGRLFRNTGSGFTDVTAAAGLAGLKPSASVWADTNNDLFPDVYFICNGCPSRLFRNNGNGTFTDISAPARVGGTTSAHGAAWGDYDNDGDLDLFVANNNWEYNLLYRNEGGAFFTEVAAMMGLRHAQGNATGCNWLDYNLDGRLDLFVVGRDSINRLFRNDRTTFTEVTLASGVGDSRDSDGSAVGDFDNDGDPDIYVVSGIWGRGTPDFLFRNNLTHSGSPPAWLKVRLQGTLSNAQGIGARVRLVAGGLEQVRQIAGSTGYLSQDAPEALFGLGGYTGPVAVEIRWPSGRVETRMGIAPNQAITVTEPTGRLHDMAMVDVAPAGESPINTPLTPLATVRNLGAVPDQAAPVICTIIRGGVQVYSQVQSLGVVPPALWATRAFPPFTPTGAGVYTLTCRVQMPGDQNGANDALSRQITVTQQIADAWTKDNPSDNGNVPSGYDNWYMSPDLWVRNADDGGLIHQDPIKGITNTVYVRLRNRGNTAVFTGTVSVYWIEPSLGVRCGGWAPIGVIPFTNLLPAEVRIVSLPWTPTRSGHTCLQDVIDAPQDPYNRGLECAPQWVPWDNNVEWHNVNILASSSSVTAQGLFDIKDAEVQLVNVYDQPQDVDLIIRRMTFPMTGTITVRLPAGLFDRWLAYGSRWGEGIEVMTDTQEIRITAPVSATIGAVPMLADEAAAVGLHFVGPAGLVFEMAVEERIQGITTGGVAYQWVIPDTTAPQLIGRAPTPDATGVPLTAPLVFTFDEPIGPLSLKLALTPDPGGWSFTWDAANTVVTATHAALAGNRTYTVTVNANDAAGNPLAPVTWRFATVDTIAPQVVAVAPANSAANVALDAALIVTFTEVISPASLNLTLLPNPGGWSYTWSGDGMAVTAQHAALAGQTVYTATVTAKDSAGNAVAPPHSWSFTTRRKAFPIYLPLTRRQ